ncbi:MAG: hypothetical protein CMM15_02560 [Rhodospirillaceae bacterium]|nr:hypothetical protein [Rhodospirillaceae bacterium]
MKALFEVGEEVILVSKNYPEFNGEYIIESFMKAGTKCNCQCGKEWQWNENVYVINANFSIKQACGCTTTGEALESSLRKKHKGSDFSFDEMMKEIKSKKQIEV